MRKSSSQTFSINTDILLCFFCTRHPTNNYITKRHLFTSQGAGQPTYTFQAIPGNGALMVTVMIVLVPLKNTLAEPISETSVGIQHENTFILDGKLVRNSVHLVLNWKFP